MTRKIFLGASSSAVFTGVTAIVAVLQLRWVVAYLSPQIAGIWILYVTMGNYIAFFDLGLSPTLSREISFVFGKVSDEGERASRVRALLATSSRVFQFIAVAAFFLGLSLGTLFLRRLPATRTHLLSWAVFCLGAAINLLGSSKFAALFGLGFVATERLVRSFSLLLGLLCTWLVLHAGFGLIALAIVWSLQGLLARGIAWSAVRRNYPQVREAKGDWDRGMAKSFALPSLRFAVIQLGAILILQSANLIIAARLGPAMVPPYEAAAKICVLLMTFSSLVATTSVPYLSRAFAADDTALVHSLLVRNLKYGLAMMVILVTFVAFYSRDIVQVWLGPRIFPGQLLFLTLLLFVFLETHHVIYASALMAAGEVIFAPAAIFSGLLTVVLAYVWAPIWGLLGVALAAFISQLVTNNWYAPYKTIHFFRISWALLWREVYLPLACLWLLQTVIDYGLGRILSPHHPATVLCLRFAISTLFGLGLGMYIMVSSSERGMIRKALSDWRSVPQTDGAALDVRQDEHGIGLS